MTAQQMFNLAHKSARHESKLFGMAYGKCFGNALRGLWAVKNGYRGIEV